MRKRRLPCGLFIACLTMTGCEKASAPLVYSSPAGAIDRKPTHPWGEERYPDMPPEPDGGRFDPTGGKGVQGFADYLIGERVASFVALRHSLGRNGPDYNGFFPAAEAGPGPGICRARHFAVPSMFSASARRVVKAGDGEWLPDVYAVAGSVAPLSEPWPDGYKSDLNRACQQRRDMDMWFSAEPHDAYRGAQLADAVIVAARRQDRLPFALSCTPFPPDMQWKPQCQDDVRKSVASIDPRAIIEVRPCDNPAKGKCLAVILAKKPERDTDIEDRWSLDISFRGDGALRIESVEVGDDQIIFD